MNKQQHTNNNNLPTNQSPKTHAPLYRHKTKSYMIQITEHTKQIIRQKYPRGRHRIFTTIKIGLIQSCGGVKLIGAIRITLWGNVVHVIEGTEVR